MLFNFLWKNRTHYIRKSVVMNNYESGGLNVLDFTTLNYTFKINWAKHFIKNPVSIWNFIPQYIFSKFGGLEFILGCNYNVDKIPVKLSRFHRQVLLSWSLIYKHNFSPHRYIIWNNRDILYKNKSLYFPEWVEKQVLLVGQLFNSNGQLMSYSETLYTFKFPISPKQYAILFDAISIGIQMLFKNHFLPHPLSLPSPLETDIGMTCFRQSKKSNKKIRSLFQNDVISIPYIKSFWNGFVADIRWKKVWSIPSKYLITNKVKEVSFKILHKYYPANHFMTKFKRDIDVNCCFCGTHPESVQHLFWSCSHSRIFWKDFSQFIIVHLYKDFSLKWEDIVLCFFRNYSKENAFVLINLMIILAKYYIHKCKYTSQKPTFIHFHCDIINYINLIKKSKNKKAQ
uniref:Reverse transcriptase zinc-binding domain-containing protein n=1 Tax=Gouania willdenowi TaxID=441366 RepID=A0A8C5H190_GOUWI